MIDLRGHFAANVVRLREQRDMSQEELARRAGLHRTEISQLERGLRLPRLDTLVKLAGALSVTADELLGGLEWKPEEPVRYGSFRVGGEGEP